MIFSVNPDVKTTSQCDFSLYVFHRDRSQTMIETIKAEDKKIFPDQLNQELGSEEESDFVSIV